MTSLGLGFVLTPIIISYLGTEDYGLWLLVAAVAGYFSLFDLGLKRTLIHETAVRRARGEEDQIRESLGSFTIAFTALGSVIMLATVALALVMSDLFTVPDGKEGTAQFLLLLVGGAWAIQFPSNVALGVLLGYERYDAANGIDTLVRLVEGTLSGTALILGAGLEALAIIMFCTELAKTVARVAYTAAAIPAFRISRRSFHLIRLRETSKRNLSFFVGSANSVINNRADLLIIGAFLPLSAVGVYGVGLRLIQLGRALSIQVNEVLVPMASRLASEPQDRGEVSSVLIDVTRISGGLMTAFALMFILFGDSFLDLWIGPEVRDAYVPLVILSVASVIILTQDFSARLLLASELHRAYAALSVGVMVSNLTLTVILVQELELLGVALGTLIPFSLEGVISLGLGCRLAQLSPLRLLRAGILPFLLVAVLAGLEGHALRALAYPDSWPVLVAEVALVGFTYVAGFLVMSVPLRQLLAARAFARPFVQSLSKRRAERLSGSSEGVIPGDKP